MTTTEDKLVQYLVEARAMELALVRTLQANIAMTPSGRYRTALERHLRETQGHADRIGRRLSDLGSSQTIAATAYDVGQKLVGQLLALGKTPLDLLRGASPDEKLLKNAKDSAATEALEIATYDAIEQLAQLAGDELTARLAAAHRADEEAMLATLREAIPALTAAVVDSEVAGRPSYDPGRTGAAQAAQRARRELRREAGDVAAGAARAGRRVAADARRAAAGAVADAASAVQDAVGAQQQTTEEREEQRRPFADYDTLTVEQVHRRLDELTPAQLRHIETYERAHKRRRTVLDAVARRRAELDQQQAAGSSSGAAVR